MTVPTELPLTLLANRIFKYAEADFFEALAGAGLGDIRMRYTALFEALDDRGTRGSVLAGRLGMTQQAMAQLLDEVEAAGYVTRSPDPDDRRARLVMLTDRGRFIVTQCYEILTRIETDYARRLGDDDEFTTLKRGLARLLETFATAP